MGSVRRVSPHPAPVRPAAADGSPRAAFVERMADELTRAGVQRMASRVFAAVVSSDEGRMTAAELSSMLQASPAAISGAVRYLEQVDMIRRSRDPGSRRDHFALADDVWYEALAQRNAVLEAWQRTMADGAATLGPDTPAGRRLDERHDFFAFMSEEMPGLLERWRAHREARRRESRRG